MACTVSPARHARRRPSVASRAAMPLDLPAPGGQGCAAHTAASRYRGVMATVTIPTLHAMKRDGRKIVGVVAWDYQIAQIVDRAGVDIVSVGDSVGVNLWGQPHPLEVTMEEMIVVCKAVRRG